LAWVALILEPDAIKGLAGRKRRVNESVSERYFGRFRNALAASRVMLALPRIIQALA